MLQQYPISDLLTWLEDKTLVLNVGFQRRSVWPPATKTYLIDTILRERPIPTIYIRTIIDPKTRKSYREVVDGQQRLRSIHEFVEGKLVLGLRAEEYRGKRYSTLDDDLQRQFLSYQIAVDQLFSADDDLILDIFRRLNSYGVQVSPQELRHGRFQGEFRWAVIDVSKRWSILWDRYRVVGLHDRVRMLDDELVAQLFGVILEGVMDGGQPSIEKLYKTYDRDLPTHAKISVDTVLTYIMDNLAPILETGLARSPHFLMLFAAVAHALFGIPVGGLENEMPARDPGALSDLDVAKSNLATLADVLEADEGLIPARFASFKMASAGSTHRIRTRRIRFPMLYRALLPEPI